jgi:hypothetical protein
MGTQPPWHEQDEFLRAVEPVLFGQRRMAAALAEVEAFGDLAGGPYDHTAKRLVVMAKK